MFLLFSFFWLSSNHVFTNAKITTLSESNPGASVLVIEGDKIAYIGNDLPEKYRSMPLTDLKGQWVLPGLTDAHAHFLGLGSALERLDLRGTLSYDDLIKQVQANAAQTGPNAWIVGRGWDQNLWKGGGFPHHGALSKVTPANPVCLYRVDGHALLLNARAMQVLGINSQTRSPEGGQILFEQGEPTGVLIDNALELVTLPELTLGEKGKRMNKAGNLLLSLGLVGIHDAGVTSDTLRALEDLAQKGDLPIRIYAMLEQDKETLAAELPKGPRIDLFDGFLTIRCIKVYADGALGSRGAWMKAAYSDQAEHKGLQVTTANEFNSILEQAKTHGFQVATHAIGDQANRFVLDRYHEVLGNSLESHRFRVEHAQIVSPSDIPLFHSYGVIPSMQPTHCTSDMDWAGTRVGPERLKGAYAWRAFIDSGCFIPMGSDFPVEKPSPWDGLYSAITRRHQDGTPVDGFFPSQVLTRLEALKGFTIWAARAAFQEEKTGSLEPGKYADFIVIDRDYFSIPDSEIPKIKVLRTVVGGKTVFSLN